MIINASFTPIISHVITDMKLFILLRKVFKSLLVRVKIYYITDINIISYINSVNYRTKYVVLVIKQWIVKYAIDAVLDRIMSYFYSVKGLLK